MPVVGFDLDMTLVDSRAAILASFAAVAAETGVAIDPAGVDSRLGIKLEDELAHWFPAGEIAPAMEIYRRHYPLLSGPMTSVLPGAREALAAARAAGSRVVVISAKFEPAVRQVLDEIGLAVDEVFGGVHGPEKASVLAGLAAAVYVGDTPADMAAAVRAGAWPVGVATGSFAAADLAAAGAAVVLASLAEFPDWFAQLPYRDQSATLSATSRGCARLAPPGVATVLAPRGTGVTRRWRMDEESGAATARTTGAAAGR